MRNKKDLVEGFIEDANITPSVDDQWKAFIDDRRARRKEAKGAATARGLYSSVLWLDLILSQAALRHLIAVG